MCDAETLRTVEVTNGDRGTWRSAVMHFLCDAGHFLCDAGRSGTLQRQNEQTLREFICCLTGR